jgi:hypothetical protein
MTEKRFTKIKFDGSKMRLEYEQPRKDGDPDEFTLLCADAPAPEFTEAFAALAQDVIAICELPSDQLSKIKVRGVTLTYSNDIMGACITALKTLKSANAPLVINTPHLPAEAYGGDDTASPTLDTATCDRLRSVCEQAARYLNGERAQASLFVATTAA